MNGLLSCQMQCKLRCSERRRVNVLIRYITSGFFVTFEAPLRDDSETD